MPAEARTWHSFAINFQDVADTTRAAICTVRPNPFGGGPIAPGAGRRARALPDLGRRRRRRSSAAAYGTPVKPYLGVAGYVPVGSDRRIE